MFISAETVTHIRLRPLPPTSFPDHHFSIRCYTVCTADRFYGLHRTKMYRLWCINTEYGKLCHCIIVFCDATRQIGSRQFLLRFLDQTCTQSVRAAVNEWSADHVANYTSHNRHKRRTSMLSAGFETADPAIKRLQMYNLDGTSNWIGVQIITKLINYWNLMFIGPCIIVIVEEWNTSHRFGVSHTKSPTHNELRTRRPMW